MTPAITLTTPVPGVGSLRRWLAPSFSDCLFVALIAWLFMAGQGAWSRLLLDGDVGWHIRTGEHILEHRSVPYQDLFSFSKPGAAWYAWEWGADVVLALLHRGWALKGIVLLAGVQIALFAVILVRWMLWRGANTLFTIAVALAAVGASSIHYLARPHLYTLVLIPVSLWIVERDRRNQDRWVWSLVPLAVLWTNLHGGFLALIACLGLVTAGVAIESWWSGSNDWSPTRRYGILTAVCALATFVNPYGWRLHQHIAAYLASDWIRGVVDEFQSPKFRSENLLQYEALLLAGLVASGFALARRNVVGALWILFWAHQSLGAVRHVTVFVTVAAPLIAAEATRWWSHWVAGASRTSTRRILDALASDMKGNFGWTSLWPVAFVAGLLVTESTQWPQDFPELRFPVTLVNNYQDRIRGARVLATDQVADYLIYRFYPAQRVFFDGRSDFFGQELGLQYIRLSNGGHDWRQLLDRFRFDVALIPVDWPLATLLKQEPGWKLLEDNGKSLIFVRTEKTSEPPLMKSAKSTEIPIGDLIDMRIGKAGGPSTRPGRVRGPVPGEQPVPGEDWRLPSGLQLAEFALRGGFIAPGLLKRTPPTTIPEPAERTGRRRKVEAGG